MSFETQTIRRTEFFEGEKRIFVFILSVKNIIFLPECLPMEHNLVREKSREKGE